MSITRYAVLQLLSKRISRVELLVTQSKMSPAGRNAWALYQDLALSAGNSDFRLYELLKNNSRFLRITDATSQFGSLHQQFFGTCTETRDGGG